MPSDDTTPPVTKMYLTGRCRSECAMSSRQARAAVSTSRRTRSRSSGVSTPMASAVVSTVRMRYPCSSARSCSRPSASSSGVWGRAARVGQRTRADTRTGPDGARRRRRAVPARTNGHRLPAEVQRVALAIDDDLDDAGIVEIGRIVDPPPERAHRDRPGRSSSRRDGDVDRVGRNQRLVALDVDDEVALELARRLRPAGRCRSRASRASSRRCRRSR